MDIKKTILLLALLPLISACGGRTLPGGGRTDGGSSAADGAAAPRCVIAIRTDHCCSSPEPATAAQVAQDPCLVPYPATSKSTTAACKKRWPKECEVIGCARGTPPSRLVQATTFGTCAWKNECDTDADCVPAHDARQCCHCGAAYPASLVSKEPCLHDLRLNHPAPAHCRPKACYGVLCKPCPGKMKATCKASNNGVKACTPFNFWHK